MPAWAEARARWRRRWRSARPGGAGGGAAEPTSSRAPRSGSAPTRPTCRSPTRRGRGSRTRSPSSSPRSSGASCNTPGIRCRWASCGARCVENRCDVIPGYAQGDELVLNTNHYYTSTHVLVTRADSDLADVTTLADPRLKGRRIGVIAGTPPASASGAARADGRRSRAIHLMVDTRHEHPNDEMIAGVLDGEPRRRGHVGPGRRAAGKARGRGAEGRRRCSPSRARRGSPTASPWGCGRARTSGSAS